MSAVTLIFGGFLVKAFFMVKFKKKSVPGNILGANVLKISGEE